MGQGGHGKRGDYDFGYGRGNENHRLETGFFVHHRVESAVKRTVLVSDRVLFIVLRGRLCNIIVVNFFCKLPNPAFLSGVTINK